ncbi:Multiple RNA-binding domain-containing protein 1 [Wickerhamiella sorbophila]|uniref:Multiple RNA-binding domain-containing protein 1 n=1 Tax=Wickerhamiella sorbophila TaxID=45607 RepID=A0A2T0FFK2_9ASCO|nr:Multiple RNA-binding domain-containing protein 1 [Wickerhamiella sorbophila]PRT53768.1 Multiple RNA-binding domain-containing protein 1 [Wickerhamiella sorbophila]
MSSRVIVKNLPPKATETSIREHFSKKGLITDVKLLRKKDGSSRRFAFVGYKNEDDALSAVQYFNESFMNTFRLSVELAKTLHDSTLVSQHERSKRKHDALEREKERLAGSKRRVKIEDKQDDKLEEFLNVMKPQSEVAMWRNDETQNGRGDTVVPSAPEDEDMEDFSGFADEAAKSKPEDEPMVGLAAFEVKSQAVESPKSDADEEPEVEDDERIAQDPSVSDADWLRQRQTRIKESGEKPEELPQEPESVQAPEDPEATSEPEVDNIEALILETGRLFVRNLSYTTTEESLGKFFQRYNAKEVHVPVDGRTDKVKGFAYISFEDPQDALHAYHQLDGSSFEGRLMHIMGAKPKKDNSLDEFDLKQLPLKKQQQLKRKANAAKQQFSWNSLYLNQDAVLETVAKKLGVTKSQMLDPTSSNMAVKQALAESSVLQSVQEYFRSKGVDLDKFSTKETSDKVILVKNFPFNTSIEEISDMFAQYGEVVRTLMPPDGGLAIVQYQTASAGRTAFTKLSFRRLGNSILYLQKAPKGVLDENVTQEVAQVVEKPTTAKSASDLLTVDNDEDALLVHTSLFIKNLNFATTSAELSHLFKPLAGFVKAQVQTKPDPKNAGKRLSMGFGFAEFKDLETATTAMNALQDHVMDGHKLQIKLSHRGTDQAPTKAKGTASTKIIIKNIPFETTKKDVMELFGTFGQLRSVRLPRKFNKQARGFAFAEFATAKEAEHAMTQLKGAHLLGRRLVMEYAQADAEDPEEEIARMEAKVQSQVAAEDLASMRVRGQQKGIDMDEDDQF